MRAGTATGHPREAVRINSRILNGSAQPLRLSGRMKSLWTVWDTWPFAGACWALTTPQGRTNGIAPAETKLAGDAMKESRNHAPDNPTPNPVVWFARTSQPGHFLGNSRICQRNPLRFFKTRRQALPKTVQTSRGPKQSGKRLSRKSVKSTLLSRSGIPATFLFSRIPKAMDGTIRILIPIRK